MGTCSNFILIEEEKLRQYFEKQIQYDLQKALEQRQWHEIIYYDNETPIGKNNGFTEIPPGTYNKDLSRTLSMVLHETSDLFSLKKYECGYWLSPQEIPRWLNFMFALCKRFYEHAFDEVLWKYYDLQVSEEEQAMIEAYFDWQQSIPVEPNTQHAEVFVQLSCRLADFRQIQKQFNAGKVDFLLFYLSY